MKNTVSVKIGAIALKTLLCMMSFASLIFCGGCSGCSKSGLSYSIDHKSQSPGKTETHQAISKSRIAVKMQLVDGVYVVPVEINGVEMEFIFDTGASDITISATEALFLYKQGKLSDNDFRGSRQYLIADGTSAEGTVIILRKVKIGTRVLENVEASIVHNLDAPLLIGQSALCRFGKITIDYERQEILID